MSDYETCATPSVDLRHLSTDLAAPQANTLIGAAGRIGTTLCGQLGAMNQLELSMWYAEWKVPIGQRMQVDELPICPACSGA